MKNPLSVFIINPKGEATAVPSNTVTKGDGASDRHTNPMILDKLKGTWVVNPKYQAPVAVGTDAENLDWTINNPRSSTKVEINGKQVDPQNYVLPERKSWLSSSASWVAEWIRYRRQLKLERTKSTTFTHHTEDVTDKAKHLEMKIAAVCVAAVLAFFGWAVWGSAHTNGFAGPASTTVNYPGPVFNGVSGGAPPTDFTPRPRFGTPCPGHWRNPLRDL